MAQHRYLLKASTEEFDQWRLAANACGLSLAAYIRMALNGSSKDVVKILDAPLKTPLSLVAGGPDAAA